MIVNCVAYQNGRKLADISVSEISSYISRPDCFVWVALKDPDPAELQAMQQEFGLHELAVEDAQHGHQRPKIEEYDHALFVVLHLIELKNGELNVGEVAIFAGSNHVLSVRSRAWMGMTARSSAVSMFVYPSSEAKDRPNTSNALTGRCASTVNCGSSCSRISASRSGHTE